MRTITEIEEIEFAIEESRSTTSIVPVNAREPQAVLDYLYEHYDCGACHVRHETGNGAWDVWSEEPDWRLWITEAK